MYYMHGIDLRYIFTYTHSYKTHFKVNTVAVREIDCMKINMTICILNLIDNKTYQKL